MEDETKDRIRDFKELRIWQKGIEIVVSDHRVNSLTQRRKDRFW